MIPRVDIKIWNPREAYQCQAYKYRSKRIIDKSSVIALSPNFEWAIFGADAWYIYALATKELGKFLLDGCATDITGEAPLGIDERTPIAECRGNSVLNKIVQKPMELDSKKTVFSEGFYGDSNLKFSSCGRYIVRA